MGFRLADRMDLVFLGSDGNPLPAYDQCQITVRAISIDTFEDIRELLGGGIEARREDNDRLRAVLAHFVESLVEWNLENADGTPTPHTVDAIVAEHPKELVFAMLNTWRRTQEDGPTPFGTPSSDGAPLAEIPVESLAG